MFGIRVFAIGLLLGVTSGIFVTHFHVIRTTDGFDVVPRVNQPPLRSSYCDVREWSTAMWTNYPEVTAALTKSGRSQVIGKNLTDNLVDEILPKAPTRKAAPVVDSSVARRPVPVHSESGDVDAESAAQVVGTKKIPNQWLEQKSPLRQQWESMVDSSIAPLVDEPPAPEATADHEEVLPESTANEAVIQKLEERFRNAKPLPNPEPDGVEAVEEVARDLLQQVIPKGTQVPRSVAPLRDLGELLNAPAPANR